MMGSDAQRAAWRNPSPYHRALIMAEKPDDFERDQSVRLETTGGTE